MVSIRPLKHLRLMSGVLLAGALASAAPAQDLQPAPLPPTLTGTPGMPQFAPSGLVNEAGALTQQFIGTLLPTLQNAMQAGGPLNAIEVCAVEAPRIAQRLSEESGWQVTRVSLKARNASTAIPDAWETQVLNMFDQRQRAGETPATLNVGEIVNGRFRYMQAQATMPLCLNCHGSEVSAEVLSAIRQKYPNDLAIGYKAGEIRGAISLSRTMP